MRFHFWKQNKLKNLKIKIGSPMTIKEVRNSIVFRRIVKRFINGAKRKINTNTSFIKPNSCVEYECCN